MCRPTKDGEGASRLRDHVSNLEGDLAGVDSTVLSRTDRGHLVLQRKDTRHRVLGDWDPIVEQKHHIRGAGGGRGESKCVCV